MKFSRPEYWIEQPFSSPGDLPNPRIEPRSPALQADSLPAEPQGKPKNTGVGSLSLLQGIFPTQESNPGLLHCRRILYQLSCEGRLSYKSLLSPVCDIIIMLGFTPSFCFPCVCVLFFEEVDFSGFLFYFFSFQSIFLICYFNFSVEFLTIL